MRRGDLFDAIITDPPCESHLPSTYQFLYLLSQTACEPGPNVWVGRRNHLRRSKLPISLTYQHPASEPSQMLMACSHNNFFLFPRGDQPYIPPTKPYELSHLAIDLVLLARYLLKAGGRLVFFLPTVTDEYEEMDIYSILCDGMEVIGNSLQDFGSWGRRVSKPPSISKKYFLQYRIPSWLPYARRLKRTILPRLSITLRDHREMSLMFTFPPIKTSV